MQQFGNFKCKLISYLKPQIFITWIPEVAWSPVNLVQTIFGPVTTETSKPKLDFPATMQFAYEMRDSKVFVLRVEIELKFCPGTERWIIDSSKQQRPRVRKAFFVKYNSWEVAHAR